MENKQKNIAVLGAGLSGMACALALQEAGHKVRVYEKEAMPGGLARSVIKDGFVFDLHGGHVYNSKSQEINNWVFSKLPKEEWQWQQRKAKILYNDRIIDYPFELSLRKLPDEEALICIKDLIARQGSEPDNYYDWLIWNFGRAIAQRYMIPYNEKIWFCDLREMGTYWVKGKMPLVTVDEVLRSVLTDDASEKNMPHSSFYYPLAGGIQALSNALAAGVRELHCGSEVVSLEKSGQRWIVNGTAKYDAIVSTVSLKELPVIFMGALPKQVADAIDRLRSNSLTVTLCRTDHPFDFSWLYIPSKALKAHRLVFQGNLAKNACPAGERSITVETIGQWDPEAQLVEFRRNSWYNEIQIGEIITSNYTKYAYMIFDRKTPDNLRIIRDYFKNSGLNLLGRFAEWQYYNMDVCIKRALAVARELT